MVTTARIGRHEQQTTTSQFTTSNCYIFCVLAFLFQLSRIRQRRNAFRGLASSFVVFSNQRKIVTFVEVRRGAGARGL